MPGHNHSLVPKLKPGDLGTQEAFFLWNCPIRDEGLSIRQHVIVSTTFYIFWEGGRTVYMVPNYFHITGPSILIVSLFV